MKFLARASFVFLFFLVFTLSSFIFATPIAAQTTNPYITPDANPNVPKNLHTWTQTVMIEVTSSVLCQLAGINYGNPDQACLGVDQQTGKIGFVQNGGGMLGITTNMIAMLYTPPAHTSDYTSYLAQNFGISKKAYAQTAGSGFESITPLLNLWTIFRNITFLFITVIFIIIGFAIMLRLQIDQKTVMSIGNQLPKVVVSILLITFSYAIAGFLIDLMFVSTYVTINVFKQADPAINIGKVTRELNTPPVGFANEVFSQPNSAFGVPVPSAGGIVDIALKTGGSVQGVISNMLAPKGPDFWKSLKINLDNTSCSWTDFFCLTGAAFGKIIGASVGSLLSSILGTLIAWGFNIFAIVVVTIALLWALMRLWFALLTAYVFILIDIVTAPFWIVAGLIPGSPVGFTAWLRDILAHLSAYPVAIGMFLLGKVFMDTFGSASKLNNPPFFVPPLIGTPTGGDAGLLGPLIGLGIVLITPQVVNMTRDLLKAPTFKYAASAGQAIGVGAEIPFDAAKRAAAAEHANRAAVWDMHAKGGPGYAAGGWTAAARSLFKV